MERGSVVGIMTNYVEHSSANGVLLNFAFINESATEVDLARSEYLILDRNSSFHYTLPFELTAGKYRVNAYDIEMDGTLAIGTIYPAAQNEITPESKTAGEHYYAWFGVSHSPMHRCFQSLSLRNKINHLLLYSLCFYTCR